MMQTKRFFCFVFLILVLSAGFPLVFAQRTPEATPSVPALDAFHEVIARIWHEAWPNKDTALLRQLLPQVEKGIAEVSSASLPGILREKKTAWDEGVKKLQEAGSEYKKAAEAKNDTGLLSAAERLHMRFEALMRITRPALKELDEFHAVLYMLYHHYLPKNDMENIKNSAMQLKQKMAPLNAAKLPERLQPKDAQFQAARAKLSTSVDTLESAAKSGDEKIIKSAIIDLHSNYEVLERIFE
jgi:hypothetical protein